MTKKNKPTSCLSHFYISLVNNSCFSSSNSFFLRSNNVYAIYSKI